MGLISKEIDYDTIDGKWWLFKDRVAIRPLTDEEAADVIWRIEKHSEEVPVSEMS